MRALTRVLSIAIATVLVAAACQAPRATSGGAAPSPSAAASAALSAAPDFTGKSVNVATGGTGGVYIVYGAGLAVVIVWWLLYRTPFGLRVRVWIRGPCGHDESPELVHLGDVPDEVGDGPTRARRNGRVQIRT